MDEENLHWKNIREEKPNIIWYNVKIRDGQPHDVAYDKVVKNESFLPLQDGDCKSGIVRSVG